MEKQLISEHFGEVIRHETEFRKTYDLIDVEFRDHKTMVSSYLINNEN